MSGGFAVRVPAERSQRPSPPDRSPRGGRVYSVRMNILLLSFALLVRGVRVAVFVVAVVVGLVALMDWLVRTRRISPFSGVARFFRRTVDPLMVPVERAVIRAGGQPASAPWWSLVAVVVGGLILLFLLDIVGGLLQQLAIGMSDSRTLPIIFVSWAFKLVELAL